MRGKGIAFVIFVGLVAAALYLSRGGAKNSGGESDSETQAVQAEEGAATSSMSFRLGGQAGEVDEEVIQELSLSVPGVVEATFDVSKSTLALRVVDGVFRVAELAETLARPGLGWTVASDPK